MCNPKKIPNVPPHECRRANQNVCARHSQTAGETTVKRSYPPVDNIDKKIIHQNSLKIKKNNPLYGTTHRFVPQR